MEVGEPQAYAGEAVLQAIFDLLASVQPVRRLLLPHRPAHEARRVANHDGRSVSFPELEALIKGIFFICCALWAPT